MGRMPHTVTQKGKRVAIVLTDGTLITGKFIRRAKNNRWVEVEVTSAIHPTLDECVTDGKAHEMRIQKAEIKSFCIVKGQLDLKRLGRKDGPGGA